MCTGKVDIGLAFLESEGGTLCQHGTGSCSGVDGSLDKHCSLQICLASNINAVKVQKCQIIVVILLIAAAVKKSKNAPETSEALDDDDEEDDESEADEVESDEDDEDDGE